MSALVIKNLKKTYGEKVALNGISFSIEPGEFFGFLGPNGAGKTTTIRCITGIATYNSGTLSVFGIDVQKQYREARKKIGLSPQEFNVDMWSDVYQILDYMGGYFGMPGAARKKRINELLEQFRMESFAKTPFRFLSGGFKRRVMLMRALIHKPELLILDEPTAGVDIELRHELWQSLKDLNSGGTTILLTSHYLEEVEMLCNRIAIINKGEIVAIGPKEQFTGGGKKLEERYLSITKGEGF